MWTYERRLEYPVNITKTNAKLAKVIITQFGGPDGELGASQRYLSQRYSTSNRKVAGVLTDIGMSVGKLRKINRSFFLTKKLFYNNIISKEKWVLCRARLKV